MNRIFLLLLFISSGVYSQCDWKSFFPFEIGDSKFDIAKIKSSNSTLSEDEDEFGLNDIIAKSNNGYKWYEYLKDSVYINVVNLIYKNNLCVKSKGSHIQLTLSDDKMHKARIKLEFSKDDFEKMNSQYEQLLELVPSEYSYTEKFTYSDKITKEQTGEGLIFFEKAEPEEGDKLNYIRIGYYIDFKLVIDKETNESFKTNEITGYKIEIFIADLRQSRLTTEGY